MGFEDLVYLWQTGVRSRKTSRINLEEGVYLYKLVNSLVKPIILEIGTRFGGTTKLLEQANTSGNIISIDLDHSEVRPEFDKDRVFLVQGNSNKTRSDKFVKEIGYIDLLFIDGDHLYNGVKADFDNWSQAVRKGGHILFHDCYKVTIKEKSVIDFVNELKEKKIIGDKYEEKIAPFSLCHLIKK